MKKILFILVIILGYFLISGKENKKVIVEPETESNPVFLQNSENGEIEIPVLADATIEKEQGEPEENKKIVIPMLSQKSRQERLLVVQEPTEARNKRRILRAKPIGDEEKEKKEDYYNLPLIQDR